MTTTTTTTFDADRYKRSTHDQWQDAAEAWHRWGPFIEDWLGPATERDARHGCDRRRFPGARRRCRRGRPNPGGGTTRRTRPDTSSPPTSPPTSSTSRPRRPPSHGLLNVSTLVADGEQLELPPGSFDAAISRVGLIYFPDQQAALAAMLRALRPGGRVAAVVYTTPDRNEFFSIPVGIIRRRAELPPPAAGQPGPFSLGTPGTIEALFATAGLTDIHTRVIASPLRLLSAADCVRFERESFGALHQMLSGLQPDERDAAWTRSLTSCHGSRPTDSSSGRARCSSPPAPNPDRPPGRLRPLDRTTSLPSHDNTPDRMGRAAVSQPAIRLSENPGSAAPLEMSSIAGLMAFASEIRELRTTRGASSDVTSHRQRARPQVPARSAFAPMSPSSAPGASSPAPLRRRPRSVRRSSSVEVSSRTASALDSTAIHSSTPGVLSTLSSCSSPASLMIPRRSRHWQVVPLQVLER